MTATTMNAPRVRGTTSGRMAVSSLNETREGWRQSRTSCRFSAGFRKAGVESGCSSHLRIAHAGKYVAQAAHVGGTLGRRHRPNRGDAGEVSREAEQNEEHSRSGSDAHGSEHDHDGEDRPSRPRRSRRGKGDAKICRLQPAREPFENPRNSRVDTRLHRILVVDCALNAAFRPSAPGQFAGPRVDQVDE